MKVSLDKYNKTIQIDLPEIETEVKEHALNELTKQINQDQNQLIEGLCGPKYLRNNASKFKRAGSHGKTIITSLGPIRIRVQRIAQRNGEKSFSPILEQLDINHRKYSRDIRMKLADFASKMSYNDARIEFKEAIGIHVPKRTIHSFVQEIAPQLHEANCKANQPQPKQIVQGDSTQVRALQKSTMNSVHVMLSQKGSLLHLDVNGNYPKTEAEGLISDNEPALTSAVDSKWKQLCILHALNYLLFALWGERMSKIDRDQVEAAFKASLFTLVNSVKKHLQDNDMKLLQVRIDQTLRELEDLAVQLQALGYTKASSFIKRNARFMITFAELALEGIEIPYTNNRMERLMGEVSKRCKGQWRHWSTSGLRNMLAIVLTRYTNQTLYDNFKDAYIHNKPLL